MDLVQIIFMQMSYCVWMCMRSGRYWLEDVLSPSGSRHSAVAPLVSASPVRSQKARPDAAAGQ